MPSYMVIGASKGLGYAWLQFLAQNSANTVIGLARTPGPVKEQLKNDGLNSVHILPGDMASNASMIEAAKLSATLLPSGLDVLIINGAFQDREKEFYCVSDYTGIEGGKELYKEMHTSLDTNVLGVVYSINAFLPLVEKGSFKKIVAISTGLAEAELSKPSGDYDGLSIQVTYSAMKAALNMIITKFAAELREKKSFVALLALSPGLVSTSQTQPTEEFMEKNILPLLKKFQDKYPHFKGPLTPLESIEAQIKVIDRLTVEDSGSFLSHKGNKEWL